MRIVDRYIAKTVIQAISLVLMMLIGLQIFMMFVDQMNSIGQGEFSFLQATLYILLAAPYQVYLFFPVATMLGCLLGLGILANHSELIVMRAGGLSITSIIGIILKSLVFFILLITVLGETLFPKMVSFAESRKATLTSSGKTLRTPQGVWVRHEDSFIHIGKVITKYELQDVVEYAFNNNYELQTVRKADMATYQDAQWELQNVNETRLQMNEVQSTHTPKQVWNVKLRPSLIEATKEAPTEMTLWELQRYIREQSKNHLQTSNFELVFWQRLLQPLASCVMMILAIPFIFGPLRSSTLGARFLVGATVGFGFHLLNKFFGPISLVYQLPPIFAATAPLLCFFALSLWMLKRVR